MTDPDLHHFWQKALSDWRVSVSATKSTHLP